ncbi:MAG: biotin/lipoyl-containing protein, partial [Acidobacteriota bacterium]
MSTEVVMPQMGESLSEGTVTKWYKKVGESVVRDEPLFDITTDKVDTEVPAPADGVLQEILVPEGETVAVGTVVARLGAGLGRRERPAPSENSQQVESARGATPSPGPTPPQASDSAGGHFKSPHEPTTFIRKPSPPHHPPSQPPGPSAGKAGREHYLSPAVVSLAAEHRLPMPELTQIHGTGADGRITKKDVQRYIEERKRRGPLPPTPPIPVSYPPPAYSPPGYHWTPPPYSPYAAGSPSAYPAPTSPPPADAMVPAPASAPVPAAPGPTSPEVPQQYLYKPEPEDTLVPMSVMRKQIAEHMIWSQQISAQVTSFTECDMYRIMRYRDEKRDA